MTTILHLISQSPEEHQEVLSVFRTRYLEGHCYFFALALHQGLGWPLVGLIKKYDAASKERNLIWHVGVRTPDGKLLDIRGIITEEEFCSYYRLPHILREVTEEELRAVSAEIDDYGITYARRIAESLWPELPWKDTLALRAKAFADEVEALSRKHGFWICGSIPTDRPHLYLGGGDEGGYDVHQTGYGFGYTINRYLNQELRLRQAEEQFQLLMESP